MPRLKNLGPRAEEPLRLYSSIGESWSPFKLHEELAEGAKRSLPWAAVTSLRTQPAETFRGGQTARRHFLSMTKTPSQRTDRMVK
jgi:hypothetical protein